MSTADIQARTHVVCGPRASSQLMNYTHAADAMLVRSVSSVVVASVSNDARRKSVVTTDLAAGVVADRRHNDAADGAD